jgi:hypothetical protein
MVTGENREIVGTVFSENCKELVEYILSKVAPNEVLAIKESLRGIICYAVDHRVVHGGLTEEFIEDVGLV